MKLDEKHDTMARASTKFAAFRQVAEPLWIKEPSLKNGVARDDALDTSLFSVEGAVYTKWYADLAPVRGGAAAFSDVIAAVVKQKMEALDELFYKKVLSGGKMQANNFFKNHRSTLAHFAEWCEKKYDGNYGMDCVEKATAFLKEHTAMVVENKKVRANAVGDSETKYNAYRNTVAALERLAMWQGYTEFVTNLSKHEPIVVLRSKLFRERNTERAAPQDYAATSRIENKRLKTKEVDNMTESYWLGTAADGYKTVSSAHRAQMRGLWFHNTQYQIGRRGQDLRALKYSMFLLHELEFVKPAKPCISLVASLRHVKEVVNNVEIVIAWVRTRDREKCPVGATAANFVWQNDIVGVEGTPLLTIMKRDLLGLETDPSGKYEPKWRDLFFIHGKDADAEVSYDTHRKGVIDAYEAAGVGNKRAKTHAYRHTRACDLTEQGMSIEDVKLFQGWMHDVAADNYLQSSVKAGPLLLAAGWGGMKEYHCWWEGADEDIPVELKRLVFPGLDEIAEIAHRVQTATAKDMSAVKVCEVLKWLRKVYIEDAAVHFEKYPTFPAYNGHPVFQQHEAWSVYVKAEAERVRRRQQDWEVRQRDPTLAAALKEQLDAKDDAIRELKDMVKDLVTTTRRTKEVPAPAEAVPEPPKHTRPVPCLLEPKSMVDSYEQWVATQRANFAYYADTGIPIPWKDMYGERANTMRQRYHKMKPWLAYMDTVEKPASAIEAMKAIAVKYRVDEGVFIKDAFYHMVHPPGEKTVPRILPHILRAEMEAAGLPVPESRQKREYRKQKAE